jgi:hypothetical protein
MLIFSAGPWNTLCAPLLFAQRLLTPGGAAVNGLIYLIGLIVIVLFILSFLGLR